MGVRVGAGVGLTVGARVGIGSEVLWGGLAVGTGVADRVGAGVLVGAGVRVGSAEDGGPGVIADPVDAGLADGRVELVAGLACGVKLAVAEAKVGPGVAAVESAVARGCIDGVMVPLEALVPLGAPAPPTWLAAASTGRIAKPRTAAVTSAAGPMRKGCAAPPEAAPAILWATRSAGLRR